MAVWYKHVVPRLVVHEPGGVTSSLQVHGELRIGRNAELEVVLHDTKVSRHHATIACDPDGWVVVDAESRHGTFVNGEAAPHRAAASVPSRASSR